MSLWTKEHLITVIPTFSAFFIIAVILRKLLINKSLKTRMIPIKIIAVIILVLEIIKQFYSIKIGYNYFYLPLHFCSIFVYFLPLMAFYRGKGSSAINSLTCSALLSLTIGMLVMPQIIYSKYRFLTLFSDYYSFHTVFFHNLVVFAFFIVVALDLHKPSGTKKELLFISLFASCYNVVSATFAHLLQVNFSNFLFSNIDFVYDFVIKLKTIVGDVFIQ